MTDYNKKDVIYEITESNGKKTKYIGDGENERALPKGIRPTFMIKEQLDLNKGWQGAASKSYTTEEINEVLKEEIERLRGNYKELLMAVARKFPNETRHQTALRYIHAAEVAELDTPKELK
jgi:hypothetical protein